MLSSDWLGRVHFWQHARLLLAPFLAIVLLTVGCGRPPRPLAGPADRVTQRRAQLVEVFNVGVGLNTSTGEMFLFSDLQAAKLLPEASSSILVALDGYVLHGGGQHGDIDTEVVIPGRGQYPVLASQVRLSTSYDWSAELIRTDRDITPEVFGSVAARAGALTFPATASPEEVVALATSDGAYTTGASWGDVRLMLAAIGVWASQQPQSMWSAGSGEPGGEVPGTLETIWPESFLAIQVDVESLAVSQVTRMPEPGASSSAVIVRLESAEFPSGSATPSAVTLRIVPQMGPETYQRVSTANLHTNSWRTLLGASTPPGFPEAVLSQVEQQTGKTLSAAWYSSIQSATTMALAGLSSQDTLVEAGTVMAAAARGALFAQPGSLDRAFGLQDFQLVRAASDSPEPGEVQVPFPFGAAVPEATGTEAVQIDAGHVAFDRLAAQGLLQGIVFSDGRAVALKVRLSSPVGSYVARIGLSPELQRLDWSIFQHGQAPILISDESMAQVGSALSEAISTASSGRAIQALPGENLWDDFQNTIADRNGCYVPFLRNMSERMGLAGSGDGFWLTLLAIEVIGLGIAVAGRFSFAATQGALLWILGALVFFLMYGMVAAFFDTEEDCIKANAASFGEAICVSAVVDGANGFSTCEFHERARLIATPQSDGTFILRNDTYDIILWHMPEDPSVFSWKVKSFFWQIKSSFLI